MKQEATTIIATIDSHLGFGLRLASNYLTQSFSRRLSDVQLTPTEWVALRMILDSGRIAPSQLAAGMGTSRGGASKLVEKLVKRGLIGRDTTEHDRRGLVLFLTPDGSDLALALAGLAIENDDAFFAPLDPEDRNRLQDLVTRLIRHHRNGPQA